jgi:pathogenesis-related protein 1
MKQHCRPTQKCFINLLLVSLAFTACSDPAPVAPKGLTSSLVPGAEKREKIAAIPTGAGIPNGVLPSEVATALLAIHNQVRAAENANLPLLSWSEPLAVFAQEWAEHLKKSNGCKMKHRNDREGILQGEVTGENLYYLWFSERYETFLSKPEDVVKNWASEKADYRYADNSCASGKMCGHYTQIIWKDTTMVGCGRALCGQEELWVCNYLPAGNYVGEKPY